MLRLALEQALESALSQTSHEQGWRSDAQAKAPDLKLERPRQTQFGDYAVNVSPWAKIAKLSPPQIAEKIAVHPAYNPINPRSWRVY